MYEAIQVKLREAGKILYFDAQELKAAVGDYVIIEGERGLEYGQVVSDPEMILESTLGEPLRKIVRIATKEDIAQIEENKRRIKNVHSICERKIKERALDMKLVEAEYSFDRTKIIFYFTSEGRIDFRELVKDLAQIFRVRIELKQIGVRDEAKLLGGFGPCGRQLCCAKFLKDFEPVTIRMAKEQNLPLNPSKISGLCGRLMCCLAYEYECYKEYLRGLPREGEWINTKEGRGRVLSVDVFKRKVRLQLQEGRQIELDYNK